MRPNDLQPASFRGVKFLVPRDMTEEGRNTILHVYPDAAHRYAEDNGYCPPKFNLTCVVHGLRVRAQTRALRNALNRPGPGTLQHPHYGAQFCAVVGPYQVIREDIDSGVVIFEITFAVTGPPLFPGLVTGIAAVVTGLAGAAITSLFTSFADRFAPPQSTTSRTALAGAVTSIATSGLDRFGAAATAAVRLARDAGAIVDQPDRLGTLLAAVHRAPFEDRSISNVALVAGYKAVISAARDVRLTAAAVAPSTRDLTLRRQSLDALADTVEAGALAALADAMAGRTYTTADEVESDETWLADAWDGVQGLALPAADQQAIAKVYVAASEVLRDREVRLPRITTIDAAAIPASVLAYMLYDSDQNASIIVANNPRRSPLLYDGQVSVLVQSGA
ncbi:MAG: DNA circularization N-terminal domain-containing protein [Hyphomicrobium sp.]|nr:DNA circularization N-terminal domain-containing protein [Hyphomicrobium sp.]